ncbi:hypothetical protein HU200_024795 [Digitaria exilis]|uniref:F-box domain-containing protein n=1 Tax=Digitaria exilis TaxID=1010633 RepID=A0A835CB18_9POAL|nr:hypothetical protein HU200_024795 [Digitaria exilis]
MDLSQPECSAGGDRLSKLGDHVLGNILSFLPANEAASAALLSSRWRHVFGAVHTVSLNEPEPPISDDYGQYQCDSPSCHPEHPPDPNAPPSFRSVVSAALIARHRRRGVVAPLRALHVAMGSYRGAADATEVDQWISYALRQAAPDGLDLGLRLCHEDLLCCRTEYTMCRGNVETADPRTFGQTTYGIDEEDPPKRRRILKSSVGSAQYTDSDDGSVVSSSDDEDLPSSEERPVEPEPMYTVPRALFSCAELRSLSLGFCRLAPPATVSLPSLVSLLLYSVPDTGADVELLIAGCPRLADLTLEACLEVTALTISGGVRLRRLALRCCYMLATVAVDASELRAFEYKGAVPDASSFLTTHGGGGFGRVEYCKVDICGAEATSDEELVNLWRVLQLFVNAKHLHLESAHLGSGLDNEVPMGLPSFLSLRRLDMRGRLADNDTGGIDAMRRILERAPNVEALSLAFHPPEPDLSYICWRPGIASEQEMLDAHHLSYSPYSVLTAPSAMTTIPCCLRSRVREINLVHYQGGTAQRALAKFLLCNAPAVEKLWCEFAEGPMFEQIQLMREIKGWLINKAADTHFG